jgi:hypothetical protein
MAKRSVRRARLQARAPAKPAAEPAKPARGRRQFWLGVLAASCLLVPVAAVAAVIARDGDGGGDPVPAAVQATATPTPSEVERLQEISHVRDKEQVQQLTDLMRQYGQDLDPVVRGVSRTVPPGRGHKVGPLATRAEVDGWRDRTRKAAAFFDVSPSGETGTNVARGALATAVRGLDEMVETYKLAVEAPAVRSSALERVRAQRDNAIKAWQTAGVQLDVINIAVGFGHQHPPTPGGGGQPPDDLPEGTGATDGS